MNSPAVRSISVGSGGIQGEPARKRKLALLLSALLFSLLQLSLLCTATSLWAKVGSIKLLKIEESINPGTAHFLARGIAQAVDEEAPLIIVKLDTPGGLVTSMRTMVKTIMNSPVPVAVFVAPSGAQAASAGVFVTLAADIAAMAPGTNIGAAHPVVAGGKEMSETMNTKVVNDLVATIKSIASRRGRNVKWAEKAVRESVSATADEALKLKVIDLIARDVDDMVAKLEGWKVKTKEGEKKLALKNVPVEIIQENLRDKVLKTISNPNIAYLLMLIGLAGLYFELSHPGTIFPGVIGGISLILAFYAFQTLSVNYAGVLLIILGAILFLLEIKVTSYGLLSIGGIICLTLGSIMLFDTGDSSLRVSWSVLVPAVAVISGFFIIVAMLAMRAYMARPRIGYEALIGEIGEVREPLTPSGRVFVHGELWNAVAEETIPTGERVEVVEAKNLLLKVRRIGDKKH
ncbi:MAG: nodulation protein NfeD [Deltaproteobacteria bacterium]|nr:nodulation protein NfeD [Deltaproteobacteria bacterium]MBW2072711.1 nodulation protein NfeD [Deltaproteobacteria bacterium]